MKYSLSTREIPGDFTRAQAKFCRISRLESWYSIGTESHVERAKCCPMQDFRIMGELLNYGGRHRQPYAQRQTHTSIL